MFEVDVDEERIFSKKSLRRHAEPGEVFAKFQEIVGEEVMLYGT